MNTAPIIVNYSQITKAIKSPEAALSTAEEKAMQVFSDPALAAALITALPQALYELEKIERHSDVLTSANHEIASLLQCHLARRATEEGKVEPLPGGVLEAKFDEKDWGGWIFSFFDWFKGLKKHKWLKAPADAEPIGNRIRAALLGDWGTGLYGAPVCSRSISQDPKGYQLLLHLGDVYYAGDIDEIKERFLAFWPKVAGSMSRAVNSNHEMYTGGKGYFSQTLKTFGQTASYFALQNDNWLLIGLDTAYKNRHRGGLTNDQIPWLRNLLTQSANRKVVLFSHHQPFSIMEETDNDLNTQLGELLLGGKIFAWYWGHEHRCILYERHAAFKMFGRCAGHSGFPYFRDNLSHLQFDTNQPVATWRQVPAKNLVPGGLVLDGTNPYVTDHSEDYGTQGYMTLEFDGPHLNEVVHLPDGAILYNRRLV